MGGPDLADILATLPTPVWVVAGVVAVFVVLRRLPHGTTMLDPTRRFPPAMRTHIAQRAGGQCEHRYLGVWRCHSRGHEADHIYPHSRGGSTSLANGQWLCRTHNRRKSATPPSAYYVSSLVRARRSYFPPGTDPTVRR